MMTRIHSFFVAMCVAICCCFVARAADVPAVVTFFEGTPPYQFAAGIDNKILGLLVSTEPGATLHFNYPQCTYVLWTNCLFRNGSSQLNADENLRAFELVTSSPKPLRISIEISKNGVHPKDYKRVTGAIAAGDHVVTVVPVPEGTVGGLGAIRYNPMKASDGVDVKVHAIRKHVIRPIENCFSARVDTGTVIPAVNATTVRAARIAVRNMTQTERTANVSVKFNNFNKKTFSRTCDVTIPAGEEVLLPIDITPPSFGVWRAEVSLVGEGYAATAQTQYAYMAELLKRVPERPKDMTGYCVFGVVDATIHGYPGAVQDMYAEAATLAGVTALRYGPTWMYDRRVPKDDSKTLPLENYDAIVDRFYARGFSLYPVLGDMPWINGRETKQNWQSLPPDVAEFADFCRLFAEHTRGKAVAYEIRNEVDNPSFWSGTAEEYVTLFRAAKKALREGNPDAVVMNAGFTTTDLRATKAIAMHRAVMKGIRDVVDIHSHHQHGPFCVFEPAMREGFFPLRKDLKLESIPWFANETAGGCNEGQEHEQAKLAFMKPVYCAGHGASGYFWYSIRNAGIGNGNIYFNYGLTTFGFEPKPNLVALNTATYYLNDRKAQEELKRPKGEFAFTFAGQSDLLVGCWTLNLSAPMTLTVERIDESKPVTATEIDIYGNLIAKKVKVNGSTVSFRIEQDPKFVLISNARQIITQK